MIDRILLSIVFCLWFGSASAKQVFVSPNDSFQQIIDNSSPNDTLCLGIGTWSAKPSKFTDSTCGNCADVFEKSVTTVGFFISKPLTLIGHDSSLSILQTNAGYGVYINANGNVHLENISIRGGVRSKDGRATDGAVVIRNSDVALLKCHIYNNDHRLDSVVVGIAGIVGREGSRIVIEQSKIEKTSWDGIALYRGSTLIARDVIIKDGRGVGIGITWDATAFIERVTVYDFWKGIGTFGNSNAIVQNSLIRYNLGWGLIATGTSQLYAANNAILKNGNCGVAVWSDSCQFTLVNNVIGDNGWKPKWVCPCVGFWRGGIGATICRYNLFWGNDAGDTEELEWSLFDDETVPNSITNWQQEGNQTLPYAPVNEDGSPLPNEYTWMKKAGDPRLTNRDGSKSGMGPSFGKSARR